MDCKSGIYEIRNIENGHFYIGSAINIKQRWIDHKKLLRKNKHCNSYLQNAWNKYGEKSFLFSVLLIVDEKENLIPNEQRFIDEKNPQYNIARVAGSTLGTKQPAHVCAAVSLANSQRVHSEETRRKLATNLGKKFSQDHCEKISKGRASYCANGGKIGNERKISCSPVGGGETLFFESVASAARFIGLPATNIIKCATGKRKTAHGHVWKYADEK